MAAENVAFLFASRPRSRDWTSQELAEFYRVESALIQGGMKISTDRGVSDEGDPWFVFCREEGGDPVVHFARIDGQYIIASPAYNGVARGLDFRSMVQDLISRHKLAPVNKEKKSNIFMHPAALLVILVGTAFFKTPGEARADEAHKKGAAPNTADGSGDSVTHAGRKFTSEGDNVLLSTIDDKLELAQNMSQLLIVAASTIFAADADKTLGQMANGTLSPLELPSVDGKSEEYGVFSRHSSNVHLASDAFETITGEQSPFSTTDSTTDLPASGSSHFESAVSFALSLMTKLSEIPSTYFDNSGDQAYIFAADSGKSPVVNSLNNEAAFFAQKAVAASVEIPGPIAGALHVNSSVNEASASQSNTIYETAMIVDQLPADLANVASLANAINQPGSAGNYLVGNNILVGFHEDGSLFSSDPSLLPSAVTPSARTTQVGAGIDLVSATITSHSNPTSTPTSTPSNPYAGNAVITTDNSTEAITSTVFIKTLDLFIQETPDMSVYFSHDHYVFFNPIAMSNTTTPIESVSIIFNDGSSIAIVGQSQSLNNIISQATHLQ